MPSLDFLKKFEGRAFYQGLRTPELGIIRWGLGSIEIKASLQSENYKIFPPLNFERVKIKSSYLDPRDVIKKPSKQPTLNKSDNIRPRAYRNFL